MAERRDSDIRDGGDPKCYSSNLRCTSPLGGFQRITRASTINPSSNLPGIAGDSIKIEIGYANIPHLRQAGSKGDLESDTELFKTISELRG